MVYATVVGDDVRKLRSKRGPGVAVDFESIRRARLAAGLSLADVAGDRLSRTAVHRVETGKVRPSMATLHLIAERTGVPLEQFLASGPNGRGDAGTAGETPEQVLDMVRLEQQALAGEHAPVLEKATDLLANGPAPRVAARLHHWAGVAHVNLGQPAVGLIHLRQAVQIWREVGDPWMAVEARGWMARALQQMEDSSAADVAIEALRDCRQLDPVPCPTEARILDHLASIYLHLHEWERAIATYAAAVEAHGVCDLRAMARMYDGLSIAHQGLGDIATATSYAVKSTTLTAMSADRVALARAENNIGVLLLRAQRWSEAEIHLNLALEHCEAAGITFGRSHVLLSLGQLAEARGDLASAERFVREATAHAEGTGETASVALGHQWMGRILCALGRYPESDRAFEKALALLGDLGVPRRLAECHREYAGALQAREDLTRAVVQWQQAAELWQPPIDTGTSNEWIDVHNVAN
jgi:tetratricopeptide (TPR) repeat protein